MLTASSRRKTTLLLLLAAILAAPWASAAGPRNPPDAAGPAQAAEWASLELFGRLWSFLWSWSKEGCHLDPNGLCSSSKPQPPTKTGCHVDPDGRCVP